MKYVLHFSLSASLVTALLLVACGGGGAPATPTLDIQAFYTRVAQTAYAHMTQTALAAPVTPTDTPTPTITLTPRPTNTPLITNTPEGMPSPTPLNVGGGSVGGGEAYDDAVYVADVTIPDGSAISPGATFVKTWRVRNTGVSTWTANYRVVYGWASDNWKDIKGKPPAPSRIGTSVPPGEEVEVSVTLKAPVESGYFQAVFRLQNDRGYNFGEWLTVVIKVTGTPVPTATATATP